ncbi:tyrosine-protein phosphatase non-receptor type 23-like [Diaphorina citri]|uniref:Tyrosine-protein phosphatase non-receptor type 23-like n=1 Tax=Diaphorina citri TaxID=121845 RepID=A0A3Q0IY72_DIACI|nr:tyrosine-protein phosphatase non-receptor type 23-like [Diaphorina citri]
MVLIWLDTPVYWPVEKGQDLDLPKLRISLQSRNLRGPWTERILSLQDQDRKVTHVVVHLQLTSWPGSSFPSSPSQFLSLVNETWTLYKQQRSLSHHIVVHCSSGIGRSGLFVVILLALGDINSGRGIPGVYYHIIKQCCHQRNPGPEGTTYLYEYMGFPEQSKS